MQPGGLVDLARCVVAGQVLEVDAPVVVDVGEPQAVAGRVPDPWRHQAIVGESQQRDLRGPTALLARVAEVGACQKPVANEA